MRRSHALLTNGRLTSQQRHGHTLVELVLAMAVSTFLLGGMASTIFIASRGASLSGATADTIEVSDAVAELTDEIRYAIFITQRSTHMIQFAVADRDGDGQPDVIRYEWSGSPGDPLTRSFNHGSAKTVAEDVHEFALSYGTQQTSEEIAGPDIESSEAVLIEHTASSSPAAADITSANWIAQYFHPDDFNPPLPAGTTSWKITKVEIFAKETSGKNNGEIWTQIRPATGDSKPTSTVLESVMLWERDLSSSFAWASVNFSSVRRLSPTQGHCLVLEWETRGPAATIRHETSGGSSGRLDSQDGGATWNNDSPNSLFYKIYGTYTTPSPPITITREYLTLVGVSMQIGDSGYSRINTGVNLLNTPELLSGYWKLDFDEDPRNVDSNFDGVGDWSDQLGAALDLSNVIDGVWHSPKKPWAQEQDLTTAPDNNFVKATTVNVRYRATSVGGLGTAFWINAENSGSVSAGLVAAIYKPDADTQELRVGEYVSAYRWDRIYSVTPNDFIDLRLVINPATDSYSVFIDGVFMDTFAYVRGFTFETDAVAWIYSEGNKGEFDSVSIRVSE